MGNIKTRTLEFIHYKGLKMKAFEEKCGLSSGYVTSMRNGFGPDKLNNVLNAFPELNRDWLLYGEGSMLRSDGDGGELEALRDLVRFQREEIARLKEELALLRPGAEKTA